MSAVRPTAGCPVFLARPLAVLCLWALPVLSQDTTSAIHYKGLTFTPIGVFAAEAVWRQRNLTADIGSTYNAIPFDHTSEAHTSEFRATGRQSKMGFLTEGSENDNKVSAYLESDFLAAGTTSNGNENNGYVLRLRQLWSSVTTANRLTFAAGQMWSLLTISKSGLLPRSEAIPTTIDGQYAVGFNWARQAAFRFVKAGDVASVGVSLEGAQTTFSARNAPVNVLIGQPGGSQLNSTTNYSADIGPDLIAKVAFDPKGWGHWEIKAVGRLLRDRFVDPANAAGGSRMLTTPAGGAGFGIYVPVVAGQRDVFDLGLSGLFGRGIGRYGTSQLPDATVDSDGSLRPITAAHALASLELHASTQLDIYAYGGVEYEGRTAFVNSAGSGVGYGSPLNDDSGCMVEAVPTGPFAPASGAPCNADTRAMSQGIVGFWYRFYKGASGTVQWGMQFSHTNRDAWSGIGGQPRGADNMVFNSFRYILP
jgi:hypothetical protein